ncbi:MAG TPA: hypothetical protein VGG75_24320 [Trebonia sp.]
MTGSANVTQINKDYLNKLSTQLSSVLTDVKEQLAGGATPTDATTGMDMYAVNSDLAQYVKAGGPAGSSGSFPAAQELTSAMDSMGGSVNDQLTWLEKVLTDMISEIGTTIDSFGNAESLNTETVQALMNDFSNTITDMNNPPSGTTTGGGNSVNA